MARKSRKNRATEVQSLPAASFWRAGLYVRLSVEFNGNRGDSLETQRQIMEAYLALCPDIEIMEVYTDNGVTGRTFERAGFQKMLEDIERGKINCVVVKDLSRLGRNAIDTGYYIEKFFPLHQVRFISVNDQYDSEDNSNNAAHMIVPLKNMVNEAYAADISRKVRSQQRQAMQEGQFVGSRPPYGYLKDPKDCHKLVVNPDTAPVVRQIFQWTVDGVSLCQIVRNLNESRVPTPSQYQANVGIITHERLIGNGPWQTRVVNKLLADQVYVGDMVQGKTKAVGHKQELVPMKDWIIVKDTHESIISRSMFEKVQAIRLERKDKHHSIAKTPYTPNLLRGRIFCGGCGGHLQRHRHEGGYLYYCIANSSIERGACKKYTSINEAKLFKLIISIIRRKAEAVLGNELRMKGPTGTLSDELDRIENEARKLSQEAVTAKKFMSRLYESLVSGLLTQDEYLEMKSGYEKKVEESLGEIQRLKERQSTLESQVKEYANLADMLSKVDASTELTAQLIDALIERITVNGPEDISIDFRFESGFDELMEVLRG